LIIYFIDDVSSMLVYLSFNDLLDLFQLLMIEDKKFAHSSDNVIDLSSLNMLTSHFIISRIWIETHSRVKVFIEVERNYWDSRECIEIVTEFHHWKSFSSVILHVIAVDLKFAFNILISSFQLIINLWMINCWQIDFDLQSFTKTLLHD